MKTLAARIRQFDPDLDTAGKSEAYLQGYALSRGYLFRSDETDVAEATDPAFALKDRVEALVNHMPGMKGMTGAVSIARAGAPPYYGVTFDGYDDVHRWLAEDEIKATDKPVSAKKPMETKMKMPMR